MKNARGFLILLQGSACPLNIFEQSIVEAMKNNEPHIYITSNFTKLFDSGYDDSLLNSVIGVKQCVPYYCVFLPILDLSPWACVWI